MLTRILARLGRRLSAAVVVASALVAAPAALAANPRIHAHRGGTVENGTARFGEESIRAYRNAGRHGFVFEVDAKLTEDRVPVAIHDATLDRTTNCSGEVRIFTVQELASCRTDVLGSPGSPLPTRDAPHTEAIATIAQVLDLAKRTGAVVNLEIKNVPTDPDYDSTPGYANTVMDAVIHSKLPRRQLIIQSFVPANLDVARQRLPAVRTSLLSLQASNEAFLQLAADKDYDFISPEWPVSGEYAGAAHYGGLKVVPFTLDARRDVRDARQDGADALITDDPLMAGRALGLRPPRFFSAVAFVEGRRLVATGDLLTPARGDGSTGLSGDGHDARDARGAPRADGTRPAEPQLRVLGQHAPDAGRPRGADGDDPLQRERAPAASARRPRAGEAVAGRLQPVSRP